MQHPGRRAALFESGSRRQAHLWASTPPRASGRARSGGLGFAEGDNTSPGQGEKDASLAASKSARRSDMRASARPRVGRLAVPRHPGGPWGLVVVWASLSEPEGARPKPDWGWIMGLSSLCLVLCVGECQKVWGSAGFVRIYGHMTHRRPTDTAVAIGCFYRDRREGYRHGGRQAVRKRQQCSPRTVDRAGHPRPRHALPDCPTLFGTLRRPELSPALLGHAE